ncbi:MAG: PLDc_N domain-containing protein [Candidatus Omnitrophica bacterium]|nr:PLDc_N domain-containing protein [Candidatus Omnitrophota bacterium]
MECLLPTILIMFDIIAIVDAMRGRLSIEKKLLWIGLIVFVPGIGMFLYFLLGRPDHQTN